MCILRLPAPVIEIEAPKLASIVTDVSCRLSMHPKKADKTGNNRYIIRNALGSTSGPSSLALYTMCHEGLTKDAGHVSGFARDTKEFGCLLDGSEWVVAWWRWNAGKGDA